MSAAPAPVADIIPGLHVFASLLPRGGVVLELDAHGTVLQVADSAGEVATVIADWVGRPLVRALAPALATRATAEPAWLAVHACLRIAAGGSEREECALTYRGVAYRGVCIPRRRPGASPRGVLVMLEHESAAPRPAAPRPAAPPPTLPAYFAALAALATRRPV